MSALKSWLGIGICVAAAAFLCILLNDSADARFIAPALCLQAVILVSLYFGRVSALVGSAVTSLILTLFLFPPIGSLRIHDRLEIGMLLVFQAASILVALISPRLRPRRWDLFPR